MASYHFPGPLIFHNNRANATTKGFIHRIISAFNSTTQTSPSIDIFHQSISYLKIQAKQVLQPPPPPTHLAIQVHFGSCKFSVCSCLGFSLIHTTFFIKHKQNYITHYWFSREKKQSFLRISRVFPPGCRGGCGTETRLKRASLPEIFRILFGRNPNKLRKCSGNVRYFFRNTIHKKSRTFPDFF